MTTKSSGPMRFRASDLEVELRAGAVDDVALLMSFISRMAEFEKLEVHATEDALRESLFGDPPAAKTLLAFANGEPIAYAVYFFTFATMTGKRGLWLDDLYVDPAVRGKGVGRVLLSYLAQVAIDHGCGRFEWMVLDWNQSAIDFYKIMGASILDDWRICRIDEDGLSGVAAHLDSVEGRG